MRSCRSSMASATLRAAARALIMKKAAVRAKTYISPYHRRAIGPSRIRTGSMSGFGNTGAILRRWRTLFKPVLSVHSLTAGLGSATLERQGHEGGEDGKGR